ncbi:MAG TPA: Smr/MutS family protein [Pyrinomonadaceae bacterium]|nr:Smr/MutS family protein [Pyrinomonadaceae bacterium]
MNPQAFGILEFDQLRQLVRRHAQTDMGRARVADLEPFDDLEPLRHALTELGEAISLRARGARFSFDGVADPSESIARLKIEGAALEPLAMLDLVRLCNSALDARNAILAEREDSPTLFDTVAALSPDLKQLATAITKKILPNGELDDRASPELARIRHDVGRLRSSITRSLENLMRRSSEAIQEELVTVRNDRFVIPVRADHRGRINGVAHGSSSSGQTIFIEPMPTIEANNELQTLREAEQREIAAILFRLSEDLRAQLPAIEAAAVAVAVLDVINAKTAFGERFNCVVPEVAQTSARGEVSTGSGSDRVRSSASVAFVDHDHPVASTTPRGLPAQGPRSAPGTDLIANLELLDARHPLLEENLRASGGQVVPVSFTLDHEQTTMVISGANAGGKTVVLKTAGLLSLMALSGLPVPARSARVPFYRSVLADIGDHQSLAANLSTFTSHVANIATMIEICSGSADISPPSSSSLVLLDEVGTGTDPEEGSALGVAVVDHFKQRGAHVLATTHYSGLKMYAANEPGVLNASVEFDERTLRPTYRLLVGVAGSSSGLDIAQRFGIPADIIAGANEHVTESSRVATEYLRRIKREADEAEALRRALEEERAAVAEKFATLDLDSQRRERERQTEFEKQSAAIFAEFEKLSRELLAKIQERADRVKVERETQKRAAELKGEAQRAAKAMSDEARQKTRAQLRGPRSQEGGLPPQLRGVKVVRDGQVVSDAPRTAESPEPSEDSGQDARAPKHPPSGDPLREIAVGDRVRLLSFGSTGIVDQIKDDEAEVRVGSLRMREKLLNLELLDGTSSKQNEVSTSRGSGRVKGSLEALKRQATATELHLHSKDSNSRSQNHELNLIGRTTDEAVDLADKFLDEAFLNGLSEVRIIHGHGTGALRKAVAEFLRSHPHVARFSSAPPEKGGSGATQVELNS